MAARKIKSFSTSSTAVAEPIVFELQGENLEAYGEVSGAVLLEFISASSSDGNGDTAKAILDYLKASMDEENYTKFNAIIHDPKKIVSIETLSDIVSYLVEERTSRPTPAS